MWFKNVRKYCKLYKTHSRIKQQILWLERLEPENVWMFCWGNETPEPDPLTVSAIQPVLTPRVSHYVFWAVAPFNICMRYTRLSANSNVNPSSSLLDNQNNRHGINSENVPLGWVEKRLIGPTSTGFWLRRPVFMSRVKVRVSTEFFVISVNSHVSC